MNNAVSGFSRNSLNSRNVLPSTAAATPDVEPLLPGAVRGSQYHKDLDYERGDLTLPKTVQGLGSGGPLPIRPEPIARLPGGVGSAGIHVAGEAHGHQSVHALAE
jgi:hypothetical protein